MENRNGKDLEEMTIGEFCSEFNIDMASGGEYGILGFYEEDYKITKYVSDVVNDNIRKKRNALLDEYTRSYHNPEIPKTVGRFVDRAIEKVYDFGVFMSSFGSKMVVRKSEEDIYRDYLTERYQFKRRQIESDVPVDAEGTLYDYLVTGEVL